MVWTDIWRGALMALVGVAASVAGSAGAAAQERRACGPQFELMEVAAERPSWGLRCLRLKDDGAFLWYGEGRWGEDFIYRHIGIYDPDRAGFVAVDIPGAQAIAEGLTVSGEPEVRRRTTRNVIERRRRLTGIRVTAPWNERWDVRRTGPPYILRTIDWRSTERVCGRHMIQYGVSRTPGSERTGVRCVHPHEGGLIWYGLGSWDGRTLYEHVGGARFQRPLRPSRRPVVLGVADVEAYDLCFPPGGAVRGQVCGGVDPGGLTLRPLDAVRLRAPARSPLERVASARVIEVSGAWREVWTLEHTPG